MGERQQQDNVVGDSGRVTIREAAAILGVHPNTIKNRLRKKMYSGEKVVTEHGPTWMIDRNSLRDNTPSRATQTTSVGVPAEFVQQLAREIVREAGLARDPQKEAAEKRVEEFMEMRKEEIQAQIEFSKHMTTLISASIVGTIVMLGAFPIEGPFIREELPGFFPQLPSAQLCVVVSLTLLGTALLLSGFEFGHQTQVIRNENRHRMNRRDNGEELTVEEELTRLDHRFTILQLFHLPTRTSTASITVTWYAGLVLFGSAYLLQAFAP
jgi:hypothetical protein